MLTQTTLTELELANHRANLYRTSWLIAHNVLRAITHQEKSIDGTNAEKCFQEYLSELRRAPEISSQPA